uniref:phospholipase A2 n=1 Tax=Micropechis ikaheca TaxID=66188 RepID=A0A024AYB9_MICIK|nr:phospholipase A2 [Micropechis ikaheca]
MYPAHLLVLLAVCVSLLGASSTPPLPLNLYQFRNMIICTIPDREPLLAFSNYGCYCGKGGSGTPVDELDRCCQTHDNCYGEAEKLPECQGILSGPYINTYSYDCTKGKLTCNDQEDKCKLFICNCDRTAAMCFAKAPYKEENNRIDPNRCK